MAWIAPYGHKPINQQPNWVPRERRRNKAHHCSLVGTLNAASATSSWVPTTEARSVWRICVNEMRAAYLFCSHTDYYTVVWWCFYQYTGFKIHVIWLNEMIPTRTTSNICMTYIMRSAALCLHTFLNPRIDLIKQNIDFCVIQSNSHFKLLNKL